MRDADLMMAAARPLPLRALLWVVAAGLAVFALSRLIEPGPPPAATLRQAAFGPASYDTALAQTGARIGGLERLAADRPDDWVAQERLADALIERARLTASFRDYAAAQRALARGFAHAAPGAGPHLVQGVLDLSLHRLDRAERMIAAVDRYAIPDANDRAAAAALRGDIAFYRGRYSEALKAYHALAPAAGDHRFAIFWSATGRPDAALTAIDRAEAAGGPQARARLALLRGAIALRRGAWEEAETAFAEADRRFPGDWLVAAHRAQMLALRGRQAEAAQAFEALAGRNDDPALRDALAGLARAQGDYRRATFWAARASAGWEERMALFPEATLGHAVEHELAFGAPDRALALARRDYALRPHGATAIALGWALVANNRPGDALRLIAAVDRSSWRSAEQNLVAARAHALLGQSDAAEAAQQRALALNPRALDPNASLLWFGH